MELIGAWIGNAYQEGQPHAGAQKHTHATASANAIRLFPAPSAYGVIIFNRQEWSERCKECYAQHRIFCGVRNLTDGFIEGLDHDGTVGLVELIKLVIGKRGHKRDHAVACQVRSAVILGRKEKDSHSAAHYHDEQYYTARAEIDPTVASSFIHVSQCSILAWKAARRSKTISYEVGDCTGASGRTLRRHDRGARLSEQTDAWGVVEHAWDPTAWPGCLTDHPQPLMMLADVQKSKKLSAHRLIVLCSAY